MDERTLREHRAQTFRRRARIQLVFVLLAAAFCAITVLNVNIGSVPIPVTEIAKIIFTKSGDPTQVNIIWKIRLPRILMAAVLGGALGWTLFGVIWGLAVLGVAVTLCWLNAPRMLTTLFYLGMGWMAVLALRPLLAALPSVAFGWMLLGGAMYTVGGVMYALKWPLKNGKRFGCHEIFHVFVLLGSACFFAMLYTVFVF